MIIESTALSLGAFGFIIIGFIGGLIGGIGKAIFGGGSSKSNTSSSASYEKMLQQQAQSQRDFEQRMMLMQQQAQQKGAGISPLMIFGGIALVGAIVVLPKVMGR